MKAWNIPIRSNMIIPKPRGKKYIYPKLSDRGRVEWQIREHPGISVRSIAKRLNLQRDTVRECLARIEEDLPFLRHFELLNKGITQ